MTGIRDVHNLTNTYFTPHYKHCWWNGFEQGGHRGLLTSFFPCNAISMQCYNLAFKGARCPGTPVPPHMTTSQSPFNKHADSSLPLPPGTPAGRAPAHLTAPVRIVCMRSASGQDSGGCVGRLEACPTAQLRRHLSDLRREWRPPEISPDTLRRRGDAETHL